MEFLHTNILYQYLADLLNLIMHFFPDAEPPIINILYGLSRIYGHFKLCSVLFSLALV